MYSKVTIQRLRGISDLSIDDFRRFNLFVGGNNSGKSTILEAIFLLTGASNPELPLRINAFRGLTSINDTYWQWLFHNLRIDQDVRLRSYCESPREERVLVIKPQTKSLSTTIGGKDESTLRIENMTSSYSESSPVLTGLVLEYEHTIGKRSPTKVTTRVTHGGSDLNIDRPKSYREERRGVLLSPRNPKRDDSARFARIQIRKETTAIVEAMRVIEPRLQDIVLGEENTVYVDIGLSALIPINVMGDGLFRLFGILLAIYDARDGVVMIDEIESGFYYQSLNILWSAVMSAAYRFNVQLFATTHTLECVTSFAKSPEAEHSCDDIRLYRLEGTASQLRTVKYDRAVLQESLDSEWEVR